MGAFWAKQPNGKWCRFSTGVNCITDYNCEKEDIWNSIMERTKEAFERDFEHGDYDYPFNTVIDLYNTNNMGLEEMIEICKQIGTTEEDINKITENVKQFERDIEKDED